MRRLLRAGFVTAGLLLGGAAPGLGQETTAGLLFFNRAHPGERPAFEEGYRKHLDWHRAHADSLAWFAWDVIAGPRLGMFVDGTFGTPFVAIDERVDPAGDAADAAATFVPHAAPTARVALQLRRDLSTATVLEDRAPTAFVQVVRYDAGPAAEAWLAAALRSLREEADALELRPYTVYEVLAGGRPGYRLMVWLNGFADFDDPARNPERALRRRLGVSNAGTDAGIEVTSELWRYRADLAYLGTEEEQ